MAYLTKPVQENTKEDSIDLYKKSIDFITCGIGCNCLISLCESGFLEKLLANYKITENDILNYLNPTCVRSSLVTLKKCGIVDEDDEGYQITDFGRNLSNHLGLIRIFFDGYGGLVAQQSAICKNERSSLENLVQWPVVATSSIQISQNTVDPLIIREFLALNVAGTICDLGCGSGVMLSKICQATGNSGLGFERSVETVNEISKLLAFNDVTVEAADITSLQGVWEDVTSLIQAFVFHDFTPNEKCIRILNSYLEHFPNLRYFFYVDIVTPSKTKDELFPGFDYIHGLLGVKTRNYEETLDMFSQSKFSVFKEIPISGLPNAFLWILSPNRKEK